MNTSVSPSIPSFPDLVLVLNFRIWGPSMRIIKYLVRRPPPRSVCVYVSRNLDLVATDNGEGSPLASGSGIFQLTFKFIVKLFYEYLISLWALVRKLYLQCFSRTRFGSVVEVRDTLCQLCVQLLGIDQRLASKERKDYL